MANIPVKFVQPPKLVERRVEEEASSSQQEGVLQRADAAQANHDNFFQQFLIESLEETAKAHAKQPDVVRCNLGESQMLERRCFRTSQVPERTFSKNSYAVS